MTIRRRGIFYLGLLLTAGAIIFLFYVLFTGPYDKIPSTTINELIHDHETGPILNDIEAGDRLVLYFEASEPINVIILRPEDKGDFFLLEDRTVNHFTLASDSTGGTYEYTFTSSGNWGVFFENPYPPPKEAPRVRYWGELDEKDKDLTMHYVNIGTSIFFIVLGIIFIAASRKTKTTQRSIKQRPVKEGKGKKKEKRSK